MKDEKSPIEWNKEFQEFMATSEIEPSKKVSKVIQEHVYRELNPSSAYVFGKLALVHLVVGTITLLFCPQFGLSLTSHMGLMHWLMQFGSAVCMFGCGVFFLGTSALVASFVLRPEEIKIIRKTQFWQFALLAIVSMGIFLTLGPQAFETLAILWVAGSILGALASMEIGWLVRSLAMHKMKI